jgi:hypothetical protein
MVMVKRSLLWLRLRFGVMDDGGDAILDFGFGEIRSFSEPALRSDEVEVEMWR